MTCFGSLAFGPYTATYGGADLGLVEQAWFLESQAEVRDIRASRYGESIIGGIYLGQNAFIITRLKEWTETVKIAIHPWTQEVDNSGTVLSTSLGQTGQHGRCVEDMAQNLTLTALPGPPTNNNTTGVSGTGGLGPITIVAEKAIYAPRHNLQIPFGNMERDVHIVFQLYPTVLNGTNLQHFYMT